MFFLSFSLSLGNKKEREEELPSEVLVILVKYIYKYEHVESTFLIKLLITQGQDGRSL